MRHRTVLVAAAAALAASLAFADAGAPPVGQQAKHFRAIDSFNMRPTKDPLKSLTGRVVLFTMFQTWYESCADAVPDINAVHDKYGPMGLTVLACGEQDRKTVEPFIADKGVRFAWVLVDTPTNEQFKRDYPAPGMPWSYLIDVSGKIVWQGQPRMIPPNTIEPLLPAATQAPLLPKSLAAQQKLLDDGLWAAAKKSLLEAADGGKLDKVDAGWAKGAAEWIDQRHARWFDDADALCKQGWWWDGWEMMDDFPRRFEGMDGADKAKAKAEEIRKTPDAQKDLAAGDDVAKARDLIAAKKYPNARLVLARVLKERKGTRHADRAQDLFDALPPK